MCFRTTLAIKILPLITNIVNIPTNANKFLKNNGFKAGNVRLSHYACAFLASANKIRPIANIALSCFLYLA